MNENEYTRHFPELNKLKIQLVQKQESFFQHILLVSSSILGILITLHDNSLGYLYTRGLFLLAEVLLTLGILTGVINQRNQIRFQRKYLDRYIEEVQNALLSGRHVENVDSMKSGKMILLEKLPGIFLLLSLSCLVVYSVLSSFPEFF